ncbi:hypothetical protein [Vampirovibrio chlorellavorus]|uniref:hypothetical protein n=1 Tax=Vampirovibrio chlorellavorus TaxID=758823 RepID=UPI0026EDE250|nr:hypothetical protein [Vampirovibrio chlorellavorus]
MSQRLGQNPNAFLQLAGKLPAVSTRSAGSPVPVAASGPGTDQFGQFLQGLQSRPINLERPRAAEGQGQKLDLSA